jgi:hypothetical protein
MPRFRQGVTFLAVVVIAAWLLLFSSFFHADASVGSLNGTPTAFVYLPAVFRNYCSPGILPPAGDWLAYVNYHRALACLPPLTENAGWSDGALKHSRYMVKNDFIGHTEDSNNPWYTPEGSQAAANGNVMVSSSTATTDEQAIDLWMRGPFHAVGIIDPQLVATGFGSYREDIGTWKMGATLDVIRGLTTTVPGSVAFPVKWPGDGTTVHLRSYNGGESPNPLTHPGCAGYATPTGLPLILQLGHGSLTPNVTNTSFMQGGTPLEHCWFDETNYTNPDSSLQSTGRAVLAARDAIVLIPRNPLTPGATYTVAITASGETHTWSFSVSSAAQSLDLEPERLMR